jgi:hypothetical protein
MRVLTQSSYEDNSAGDDVATKCTFNLEFLTEMTKLLLGKVMACDSVSSLRRIETAARSYLEIQRKLQKKAEGRTTIRFPSALTLCLGHC